MDLDRMLEDARADVPDGLVGRIVAAAPSREAQRRIFWADVEGAARRTLAMAVLAACISVGVALSTVLSAGAPDNTRTASIVEGYVQIDPVTGDVETP
jgi:hypothetical protein